MVSSAKTAQLTEVNLHGTDSSKMWMPTILAGVVLLFVAAITLPCWLLAHRASTLEQTKARCDE
jgi:hypothetical protein